MLYTGWLEAFRDDDELWKMFLNSVAGSLCIFVYVINQTIAEKNSMIVVIQPQTGGERSIRYVGFGSVSRVTSKCEAAPQFS